MRPIGVVRIDSGRSMWPRRVPCLLSSPTASLPEGPRRVVRDIAGADSSSSVWIRGVLPPPPRSSSSFCSGAGRRAADGRYEGTLASLSPGRTGRRSDRRFVRVGLCLASPKASKSSNSSPLCERCLRIPAGDALLERARVPAAMSASDTGPLSAALRRRSPGVGSLPLSPASLRRRRRRRIA